MYFWKISLLPQKLTINLYHTLHSTTWPLHLSEPWLRKWAFQLQLILKNLSQNVFKFTTPASITVPPCWFAFNSVTNTIWRSNASLHTYWTLLVEVCGYVFPFVNGGNGSSLFCILTHGVLVASYLVNAGHCGGVWVSCTCVIYGGFWFGNVAECEGGQNRSHMIYPPTATSNSQPDLSHICPRQTESTAISS